jgi:hypothetical protein
MWGSYLSEARDWVYSGCDGGVDDGVDGAGADGGAGRFASASSCDLPKPQRFPEKLLSRKNPKPAGQKNFWEPL